LRSPTITLYLKSAEDKTTFQKEQKFTRVLADETSMVETQRPGQNQVAKKFRNFLNLWKLFGLQQFRKCAKISDHF
jgi:hypothetical protein